MLPSHFDLQSFSSEDDRKQRFQSAVRFLKGSGFINPDASMGDVHGNLSHAFLTDSGRQYLKDNPPVSQCVKRSVFKFIELNATLVWTNVVTLIVSALLSHIVTRLLW